MRKLAPILLLRLALLVAVFACAVLVVDYQNAGDPSFCGAGSGCLAVRRSQWSHIADIPLPVIGLCAHAGLLALVLVAREKAQTFFIAAAAAAGGMLAAGFIGLQVFQIGALCKWCMTVDTCAIIAGISAGIVHLDGTKDAAYERFLEALALRRAQVIAWGAGAVLVAALPFVWGEYPVVPPVPAAVTELRVPGKVTIVTFTDFECPFCRKMAPVLHDIQDNWGNDRVAIVRKMAPLSIHPGARPAAEAYVCTPEARREDMALRLYTMPESIFTREGLVDLAEKMGFDAPAFKRCLEAPSTKAAIDADLAIFDAIGMRGLPYTYIGPRVVAGYNPDAAHKISRIVMESDRLSLPLSWMLGLVALVAAALAALMPRFAPSEEELAKLAPATRP